MCFKVSALLVHQMIESIVYSNFIEFKFDTTGHLIKLIK